MKISTIRRGIQKVKSYIALTLRQDPVRPWSVIRYSVDAAICNKRYGASIADYFELHFFEKTHEERDTYFTTDQALSFIRCVNGTEETRRFYNKDYMYRVLGPFTKREQLFCPPTSYQEFEDYFSRHRKAFYKPNNVYAGEAIELWDADVTDIRELYERALKQTATLDEPVIQHPELARINPDSVNTVKIYTLKIRDECRFVAAEFRMGRRGICVDNMEKGGIAAAVDPQTGAIIGEAYDLQMNPYSAHPDTGAMISGYTLPNWPEVIRFTQECARACPLAYIEWDIAIRENDCVLIEANANARSSTIQMGVFHGRKKQFEELKRLYLESIT